MTGPVTGSRLLGLLEPGWRRHLVSGEPAGTLDVAPDVLAAAVAALAGLSRPGPPQTLARRWPACVVVAMAQVTACDDDEGKVWPAWHRASGTGAGKRASAGWAEAFLTSLAALRIPADSDDARQAVLAQAAVTTSSLPEFLRLAAAGAPECELAELGPAVAAVLGTAAGARFVERCRALMDLLTASGGTDGAAGTREMAALSLPRRIVDVARAVATAHPGPGRIPPCRLEPFGRGVLTRDAVSSHDPSGTGSWTAMSPAEAGGWPDPLLVFDADGELIHARLPPEPVWLLYPAGRALQADALPRILVESKLPLAWKRWRLVHADLSGVSWLGLAPAGSAAPARRLVRGRANPWLAPGPPVPGISTAKGLAVSGTLPSVRLPAGDVHWWVEVRRLGSNRVLAAAEVTGDRWRADGLWDAAPRPVLGVLVVTVTALGGAHVRGLRRVLAVAEGLAVSYSPALRLPHQEGLEAAEVVLCPAVGMTASPCAAVVPAGITGIDVTCVAGEVLLPLRVCPPHWRARIEPEPGSGGTATPWHSLGPLRLDTRDLTRGGVLRLDLPATAGEPPVEVVAAGGVVQVLEPFRRGGYPLRRLLDTVAAHGGAALRITAGTRTAVIAVVGTAAAATDPWLPA